MTITEQQIWDLLQAIEDPEIPVLSILDLGIVRKVSLDGNAVVIKITPTYSGCPAMHRIEADIREALLLKGIESVRVETVLQPAWTTDWMTSEGKEKLKAFGIAPPLPTQSVCHVGLFQENEAIQCPRCSSYHTTLISRFGSTACKALYRCLDCQEPFDYFKCH